MTEERTEERIDRYRLVSAAPSARLSPDCRICGEVGIGADTSVFAGTTIRGDSAPISIGERVNVQENCVLHVDSGFPLTIGDDVTIGHGAIVHGCTLEDHVLVGMGAIVLDGARIRRNSLVAAGALVTGGKDFPEGSMIMGSPARAVRELTQEEMENLVLLPANAYVDESAKMVEAGLMEHPGEDVDIWPMR